MPRNRESFRSKPTRRAKDKHTQQQNGAFFYFLKCVKENIQKKKKKDWWVEKESSQPEQSHPHPARGVSYNELSSSSSTSSSSSSSKEQQLPARLRTDSIEGPQIGLIEKQQLDSFFYKTRQEKVTSRVASTADSSTEVQQRVVYIHRVST